MPGPLEGYRIIDLTAIAARSFATMMRARQQRRVFMLEATVAVPSHDGPQEEFGLLSPRAGGEPHPGRAEFFARP